MTKPATHRALARIKALHTVVWAFFALCILAIPVLSFTNMRAAVVASAFVWCECIVLAVNDCRCPLTDAARGYSDERAHNFDIYLPEWLAKYNKLIFGSLFVLSQILLARRLFGR